MSPHQHPGFQSKQILVLAGLAAALAFCLIGTPALASPQGDLWNLINDAHTAAGCRPYTEAPQVDGLALQFAQTMAVSNGRPQTTSFAVGVDELLGQRGYTASSWGSMNFFNPQGGSAQAALSFWQSQGTNALIRNCGMAQLGVAVWINGSNWAASSVVATPR